MKKEMKKATTTKTTRKLGEKTLKVNKLTSATEILPPRECRRSKRSLQSSGPRFFSVCATLLYRRNKKEKGKPVKCRTADTTTITKKFLGFTVHVQERCPDPRSRSMICDRSRHAKLGRKITLGGFCLFFKPRLPQEDGAHLVSIPRYHWHRFDRQ